MKYFILTVLLSLITSVGFGQNRTKNKELELRAYLDSKQFYAPGVGNYIEFHLQFVGMSINYTGKDEGLIGKLAVQMKISQADSVIVQDAYVLETPFMKDSIVDDFYDLKRFMLAPGGYTFNLQLRDLNGETSPLVATQTIVIEELADAISISDIVIAEIATVGDTASPFYKSGYDIIPRLSTFYPEQLNALPVYFEVYNSKMLEDSVFGIKQTIVKADEDLEIEEFTVFSRHFAAEVIPVLRKVDITNLTSGKYILNYTLLNKNMTELSTQSYVFERSNDVQLALFTDEIVLDPDFQKSISNDSVGYYLESLIPISRSAEIKNIIRIAKAKDGDQARKYIQVYWSKTSPVNTYEAWIQYKQQVQLVERLYSNNFQEGFETDRGRVYLQYGAPHSIVSKEFSPSEYPYEIWRYHKIGAFSNKRFVFYNPDLVNNAYRLLHSDMVGEQKNPSWPRELARRNSKGGNIDNPNGGLDDHWGGNSEDIFRDY
jgi:GWxTD domain-containing protein